MVMRLRVLVLLLAVGLLGSALFQRTVRTAAPAVAAASQSPVVADAVPRYTRLSKNEPDGVPAPVPYTGFASDVEYVVPADTEPTLWRNDWREGLTGEQVRLYEEGLVRSGMEDLDLCKPGYTCHAAVRYRIYDQNRPDVPHEIRLQATFTTRTKHRELFFYWQEGRTKVWSMTEEGWHFLGIVEDLPEPDRTKFLKLMSISSHG